jgi:hypothetical protein
LLAITASFLAADRLYIDLSGGRIAEACSEATKAAELVENTMVCWI